jgi:branched-chain amino acid transport system substrate-binding protein
VFDSFKRRVLMKFRVIMFFVAVLAMILTIISPPLVAGDVIKIGLGTPLSGPAAGWGIPQQQAVSMLFDEVNKAGGIDIKGKKYTLELIAYDDKFLSEEGAIIANRLAYQDKVPIMMGIGGPPARAAQSILKEAGVLNYDAVVARDVPNKDTPLLFAWFPRYAEVHSAAWPWIAKKYPHIKRVAKIGLNNEEGMFSENMVKIYAPKAGIEVVSTDLYELGTTDFTPILLKVLARKPDIIDVGSSTPHTGGLICKQARELGYTGYFQHAVGPNLEVIKEVAGAKNAEKYLGWVSFGKPYTPAQIDLRKRFIARYGQENWTEFVYLVYGPAQVLPQAIEQAQSLDPHKIADALRKGEFETVVGKAWFGGKEFYGINNQILWNMTVATIKDGEPVLVDTVPPGTY